MTKEKKAPKQKKGELKLVHDSDLFGGITETVDYSLEAPVQEKKKLEIFDVLARLDARDGDFFSTLSPDMQKQFSPLVVMRWLSAVNDSSDYSEFMIQMINEVVNIDFWSLSKHPELQWRLLALCGPGMKLRHQWIPMAQRKKAGGLEDFLLQWFPLASNQEIETIIITTTTDEFSRFVRDAGLKEEDEQNLIELFDRERQKFI